MAGLSTSMLLFLYHVYVLWCTRCAGAVVPLPPNVTIPAVIVFGDSIVDTGNNNHLITLVKCNYSPYGKDFIGGVATGRFTNSKTPADILATELGIKELVPAYLDPNLQIKDFPTGVSFASGGTGYDPLTPISVGALSFPDQLKMFKEYILKLKGLVGEEKTNYILTNSIFLVVAGSNDLANTYFTLGMRRLEYDVPSYADLMSASASDFIQEIYKFGARRMAVFGAPPIGCLPFLRTLGGGFLRSCVDNYNQAAKLYNTKLSSKLHSLSKTLPQSKVVYIDIYNPLFDIIQNPQNYGFHNVDRGCCGTGKIEILELCNKLSNTCPKNSKFLFWDTYHPTEQGYRVLVKNILQNYIHRFFSG